MIIIPPEQLNQDTLDALIEEFVTRDGTDYGVEEVVLARKVEQVRDQLKQKRVLIVFDPASEQANILTLEQYQSLSDG
ncbi:YheU family protein [Simiduia agarivorans]|uniref:YheU family protein n=1 Tax=Simiduia agarivorans (strain DSM 21679 / JCM 13881 / BCRC 17597 / SA1) TaxID=1117647 RepID=K4KG31_SIMAS|nr:YheU family protein [Simiduia agarivorans]AFU98044.1 hypothetical protein M5M_04185 [Simiduia agarivorans SA1 = DSM 21679]